MSILTFKSYKEAQQWQLNEWVAGRSWHNPFAPGGTEPDPQGGECCPDFSCCGSPIAPEATRIAFAKADDELRSSMLFSFLGNLVGKNVYVAGDPDDEPDEAQS